jgi:formylglycine-generating enzyme required for sulfatase activity
MRFPWGDVIDHSWDNYLAQGSEYPYDMSPYTDDTHHPSLGDGSGHHTSPVGSSVPTGHRGSLYDMGGNLFERSWDWFSTSYYDSSPANNPRGPDGAISIASISGKEEARQSWTQPYPTTASVSVKGGRNS